MNGMNIMIYGRSGTGKSTAIERILNALNEPVYGFRTKKYSPDENGVSEVYLHDCRTEPEQSRENRIGLAYAHGAESAPEVFETAGITALSDIPEGSLVLLDELGFMENDAPEFQKKVLCLLDGNYRVIAAVKQIATPFLDAVRTHPKSVSADAAAANTPEFITRAIELLRR